ncbi:unnamed protein product [Symbiodinium natans]|uniref:DNA (cytosine-5-)-methyltransferase n=1 Tax=Symbiodinium natans TaxID=878477 RepID=A0A812JGT2_9DINO|nr:unnamed protein product [Symbiodinium natans]
MPRETESVDAILLSFFDGIGTAALVFQQILEEKSWKGHMILWESDEDLAALTKEHFPKADHRGDVDNERVADLIERLDAIDPGRKATVIIAGGPPCHDYSRIRSSAPGAQGLEGSKFVRFAELVKELERSWGRPQAVLIVENVLPQNKADIRAFEKALAAQAVMHDSSDFGIISRPRVWWTRVPWQQVSHRSDCPAKLRWSTHQGVPRVTFAVHPDKIDDFDLGGLKWPSVLLDRVGVLPCLTTPSESPEGRPAPRSSKGKVDSQTQARWLQDNRSYAPWHYQDKNMFTDKSGAFRLATAEVKEQLHHLPCGWTRKLRDKARHRALANGWHLRAAKLFFLFGLLSTEAGALHPQPKPLGCDAIECMVRIWESAPLLNGPGVPTLADADDLSDIVDPYEHWAASQQASAMGLPVWRHFRNVLPEMRRAVTRAVEELVADREEETAAWFRQCPPHIQKAYYSQSGRASVQVPVIRELATRLGWKDMTIFEEMERGFPMLGMLVGGCVMTGDFFQENFAFVTSRLRRARVDKDWEAMADEIAADVKCGRMEGPFAMPECWGVKGVALSKYEHTAALLSGPQEHVPCCFAFAVHQIGSDGQPKVRRAEDWRSSGANATVGVPDSPAYRDITAFVELARAIRKNNSPADGAVQLWGVDHEAAYRQFPVSEPNHTWVILSTPSGPTLWKHNVLMFGSTASVWSYCRIADLLAWLSRALLLVPLLHFVDDFGSDEPADTVISAYEETLATCRALGFKFKEAKAQPPAKRHKLLGVSAAFENDRAVIECADDRRQRLDSMLLQILLEDQLKPREASAIAGKLPFIAQSMFGKASMAAIRPFHQRAQASAFRTQQQGWKLNSALRSAIAYLRYRLAHGEPRIVQFDVRHRSVIYADAFFNLHGKSYKVSEADNIPDWGRECPASFLNGVGFVVCLGDVTLYAYGIVPYWFVRYFTSRRAFIYMLEILGQVLPLIALESRLHRHCVLFVDNEPAKQALMKGYGKDDCINRLVQTAWVFIEKKKLQPEWQRVCSSANVSDSVSRGNFDLAESMGWKRFHFNWEETLQQLLDECLQGPLR